MAFWERLKYAKEKAKITNQDISERSGVPLPTVNRILSGGTDSPGVDNVRAIANALGVSMDEIFSEEKKPEEITNAGLLARMLSNKTKPYESSCRHTNPKLRRSEKTGMRC